MNKLSKLSILYSAIALVTMAGCATRTVVVPKANHGHHHGKAHHVVYKVKQSKRHCWRHRGHWDCR